MYIVGIDEAGRGALAGPVVVAAVAVPRGLRVGRRTLPDLKDSKGLSPAKREIWYEHILSHPEILAVSARVYERSIEKINISRSANLAASRAVARLLRDVNEENLLEVILDGGLYINHEHIPSRTIVGGDQKRIPIKLASIVAKVTRDRYLNVLDTRHPEYGLGKHKGYGTKEHFQAIDKHGILDVHRLTYLTRHSKK